MFELTKANAGETVRFHYQIRSRRFFQYFYENNVNLRNACGGTQMAIRELPAVDRCRVAQDLLVQTTYNSEMEIVIISEPNETLDVAVWVTDETDGMMT